MNKRILSASGGLLIAASGVTYVAQNDQHDAERWQRKADEAFVLIHDTDAWGEEDFGRKTHIGRGLQAIEDVLAACPQADAILVQHGISYHYADGRTAGSQLMDGIGP